MKSSLFSDICVSVLVDVLVGWLSGWFRTTVVIFLFIGVVKNFCNVLYCIFFHLVGILNLIVSISGPFILTL